MSYWLQLQNYLGLYLGLATVTSLAPSLTLGLAEALGLGYARPCLVTLAKAICYGSSNKIDKAYANHQHILTKYVYNSGINLFS